MSERRVPGKLAKGFGGLTILAGCAWVVMAFLPLKVLFSGDKEWMDYLISVVVFALFVIPGALVILGGYQFLREVNLPNLKVLVGVYSAFGAIWVSARLSDGFREVLDQRVACGFVTFGSAVLAIGVYLLALRTLVPALGMKWNGVRSMLGKGAFTLLAWLLWLALSAAAQEVFPVTGSWPWNDLIVLLGPLIIAVGFHKLGVRWLGAGQHASTHPTS